MARLVVVLLRLVATTALVPSRNPSKLHIHDQLTDSALIAARTNARASKDERKSIDELITARAWHSAVNASASDATRLYEARAALQCGKAPRQLAAAAATAHAKLGDVDACADRARYRVRIFIRWTHPSRRRRSKTRGAATPPRRRCDFAE